MLFLLRFSLLLTELEIILPVYSTVMQIKDREPILGCGANFCVWTWEFMEQ
jgi:hypothetical protein